MLVGADAHIRPAAAKPLRGRVDVVIDPYGVHCGQLATLTMAWRMTFSPI